MSAAGLQQALGAMGIACTVEAREKLALIIPAAESAVSDVAVRRSVLALLAEHGFTHAALEIPDRPDDHAAVSGD